ncbi:MAG: ATP-grasp domain-containing protein [Bacteroidales bacterium]
MEEISEEGSSVPLGLRFKTGIICNIKHPADKSDVIPDEEAEFDNLSTVQAIQQSLKKFGVESVIIEADADLSENIRKSGVKLAFNIAEGRHGRDREAQVPAVLEMLGIPFTGSDAAALSVSLDKAMCKRLAASYGVRTAAYALVTPKKNAKLPKLNYPVIVKPDAEGSGKGISEKCVAETPEELKCVLGNELSAYHEDVLIEEYLPGREFTVGLLGNGASVKVMPPMEVIFRGNTQRDYKVYSYKIKCDYTNFIDYKCPADIDAAALKEMTKASKSVFNALGCQDLSRIDFRMDAQGHPCFLEINPLPGLAPVYSDFPMIAQACGLDYDHLILKIYLTAVRRLQKQK